MRKGDKVRTTFASATNPSATEGLTPEQVEIVKVIREALSRSPSSIVAGELLRHFWSHGVNHPSGHMADIHSLSTPLDFDAKYHPNLFGGHTVLVIHDSPSPLELSAPTNQSLGQSAIDDDETLTAEEEYLLLSKLRELDFSTHRLLDTMDENLSLLEGSIREVRTAHEIAAESNRMARRRMLRDRNSSVMVTSK